MTKIGKSWCCALLLLGLAATAPVALAQTPAGSPTKIVMAYVPTTDDLPAFVAKDTGIFARHGLDVTLLAIPLMPNITTAVVAGDVQIGNATVPGFVQAVDAGLDLVAVAGGARQTPAHSTVSLLALPDEHITKAADLRGKKVGVPGINSLSDVMLRAWLLQNGVKPTEVTIVEASFLQMHDLLHARTLDAAPVIEPFRDRILKDGTAVRVSDYMLEVRPDLLSSLWMADRKWADAHAAALRQFQQAMAEGIVYIAQHDGAADIERKYLHLNAAVRPEFSTAITPDDLGFFQDLERKLGLIQGHTNPATLIFH